jgi:signal transduction histidine kinase
MFQKTQLRLTALNAAVFFLILTAVSATIYLYTKERLIEKIDSALLQQVKETAMIHLNKNSLQPEFIALLPPPFTDRQVKMLVRHVRETADEHSAAPPANRRVEAETSPFPLLPPDGIPRTVKADGVAYRAVAVSFAKLKEALPGLQEGADLVVQAICTIEPEMSMMRSLMIIVLSGVLAGGLVTVLAGFYLASRALVPIRLAWEKQQQFVADASHELRTPLSVIRANAELMLRHPDRTIEEESVPLSNVLKESKRMAKLVETLLTLARADSNRLEIDCRRVMLDALIRQATEPFMALFAAKNIALRLELQEPIEIVADEERLKQLLVILLDNALKYTPEHGTVTVACRAFAHTVQLVVEDTGEGIPPQQLPFIFDRFYRADKARSRKDGGAGLGLSIAKWIVEKHGGKIRAESKLSCGTKFTVTLPRKG